ncbi:MAG TPA: sulfotransferase domain-containing protein [Gemmataceae bacterium]|nr:sulfotransferase domain-containing protein [Gemmataceae bacterium]
MKPGFPASHSTGTPRPAVMVVSHERSGTHFLMNTLAACYGYISRPWIDFDRPPLAINFYSPRQVREQLLALAAGTRRQVVKSHHQAGFFAGELSRLAEQYVIFYICRNPVNVLLSYWRFLHRWPWFEGPKVADPLTFARAEPCGQMMRYQLCQHANLMQRWAAHVEGWLEAAAAVPRVLVVRYEDLDAHFAEVVPGFAGVLGHPPRTLVRPPRGVNVIPGGPEDPSGQGVPPNVEALRSLCRAHVGATMTRLGY